MDKTTLTQENLTALEQGLPNLLKHIDNMQSVFGLPVVVAINRFVSDSDDELALIKKTCYNQGVAVCVADVWGQGKAGGTELACQVMAMMDTPKDFHFCYQTTESIVNKITAVAQKIYGATGVNFTQEATQDIKRLEKLGMDNLPICMAKTQYSLSDNPALLGRPADFDLTVRQISVSHGAGFLVVLCGDIMKMPGLPKVPSAHKIDVVNGQIVGLF